MNCVVLLKSLAGEEGAWKIPLLRYPVVGGLMGGGAVCVNCEVSGGFMGELTGLVSTLF